MWDDTGSSPSNSALAMPSPTNSLTSSLNSYNSRHRRYQRHQVTQIEHSLSNSLPYDYSEVFFIDFTFYHHFSGPDRAFGRPIQAAGR